MKKLLISLLVLTLGSFQMPVLASAVSDWAGLTTQVGLGDNNITLSNNISGSPTIGNSAVTTAITLTANQIIRGNSITVFNNSGTLSITGGGSNSYVSSDSSGTAAISNSGALNLSNVNISTGISQGSGTINIGGTNATVYLAASNLISGGNVNFTGSGNTLYVQEGSIGSGAVINISSGNTLRLSNGSATLTGGSDTWDGTIYMTSDSSTLTLDGFASNGILNLAFGSVVLNSGALTLLDDSTLGYTTFTNNGTLNLSNTGAETIEVRFLNGAGIINKNATGTSTFNADNSAFTTGTYNHSAGGAIINNKFFNGTNNFTGGTAEIATSNGSLTLNTGDSWTATDMTMSNGALNLGITHDTSAAGGSYNQTGGTLTLSNSSTLTLAAADSSITGGTVVINNGTSGLTIANGLATNSAILQLTSGTVTVNNGSTFATVATGNTFGGGSLVANGTVKLSNTDTETVTSTFSGTGTIEKDASGTLTFSADESGFVGGTYTQTAGITNIQNNFLNGTNNFNGGTVNVNANAGSLTLNSGDTWTTTNTSMSNGTLNIGISHDATTNGTYSQSGGTLNITGGSNLTTAAGGITGGTTNISSGGVASVLKLVYGATSTYAPIVNLNGGGTLTLDTSTYTVTNISNTLITGGIAGANNTLTKEGIGSYVADLTGATADFGYKLYVKNGTMSVKANTANFVDLVTIGDGTVQATVPTLSVTADNVNFQNGLTLANATMNILNQGFDVTGNLTVGSTIDTMNGVIATNNISGDMTVSGTTNYLIDISPSTLTSDKYLITGALKQTVAGDIIKISDYQIVGAAPTEKSYSFKVFDATSVDAGIVFEQTDKTISTALGNYGLSNSGNGNYSLNLTSYNPAVFRGQVSTIATYANQLTTNNVIFDHIGLVSQQLLADDNANLYANSNPLYSPYQYSTKDGGLWYKAYGNIERLQLTQNINTQNNLWGSLIGADFPVIKLNDGWKLLPTVYVGYSGAYQTYGGANMYQNGGQGGVMGTFYKNDFITSILINSGGYINDMYANGARDTLGNWFVGASSKSAYNIHLPKDFILQPTLMFAYNYFGAQKWASDYGAISMSTNGMNGLNIAPGVNLILDKNTWSVYATAQLVFNAMNSCTGTAGNIDLPSVKMASTYITYGIGFTKRIKDRLALYGQVMFSNGVRTGVGFQGGLQWKF